MQRSHRSTLSNPDMKYLCDCKVSSIAPSGKGRRDLTTKPILPNTLESSGPEALKKRLVLARRSGSHASRPEACLRHAALVEHYSIHFLGKELLQLIWPKKMIINRNQHPLSPILPSHPYFANGWISKRTPESGQINNTYVGM